MKSPSAIRPSTRDAIINATISVLAHNPGASLNEIAMVAGVGRATLHRLFRKREDLILEIKKLCIAETDDAVISQLTEEMSAEQKLGAMFKAVIPLGDRYHFLFSETTVDEGVIEKYNNELSWLTELVAGLKREKIVAESIPTSWAVAQLDQLIWTAWREVGRGTLAAADAPELALRTFTIGLKPLSEGDT